MTRFNYSQQNRTPASEYRLHYTGQFHQKERNPNRSLMPWQRNGASSKRKCFLSSPGFLSQTRV